MIRLELLQKLEMESNLKKRLEFIYDFSIKPSTYLQIRFKKSISIDDILHISAKIDSTLHMCILNKNKSHITTIYDYSKRTYNFYNYKQKKYSSEKIPTFNICKDKKVLFS